MDMSHDDLETTNNYTKNERRQKRRHNSQKHRLRINNTKIIKKSKLFATRQVRLNTQHIISEYVMYENLRRKKHQISAQIKNALKSDRRSIQRLLEFLREFQLIKDILCSSIISQI